MQCSPDYCYFAFAVNPSQNRLDRPNIYLAILYYIMFLSKTASFALGCFVQQVLFLQLLSCDLLWTGGEDSSHPFSGKKLDSQSCGNKFFFCNFSPGDLLWTGGENLFSGKKLDCQSCGISSFSATYP